MSGAKISSKDQGAEGNVSTANHDRFSLLLFLGYQSVPASFFATLTSLDKEVATRQAVELMKNGVYCLAIIPSEANPTRKP